MKKLTLVLTLFLCVLGFSMAQRTITGVVKDAKGESMVGASVVVKGTTTGALTDIDGKYSLLVEKDATTLVVSFTGSETQEVAIGASNVIDVTLAESTLQEVVITAQGIKRDKKALGYATTTIDTKDISNKPETDIGRALAGRTPGINVSSSAGLAGTGTKINIRGISSITGNTQPLWIVDGVPVNTSTNENNDFRDGNITPTRFLDFDPNNIESLSVLRGLSATTLYGTQGRNGVILITTKGASNKKGKAKYEVSASQSYHAIEAHIPEFQNKWGNGFDGDYGEFFSNWGSVFDGTIARGRHPYYEHRALFPDNAEFQKASGYIPTAQPDNVSGFFQQGSSRNTSLNFGLRGDVLSFNANFSNLNETGYIKNNELSRSNFNIGGVAKLTDKFTITGTFNYVKTDVKTPPIGAGQGSNSAGGPSVFANLFYTPRNIDLMGWPYENPLTRAPIYYRNNNSITNPRWLLDNARQANFTNRFFGTMSASYDIVDWLKLTYRLGLDSYVENQEYSINKGSVGYPDDAAVFGTGLLRTSTGVNTITDNSFIATINKPFNEDVDFSVNIGLNGRVDKYSQEGLESTNQVVFGLQSHRNFIDNNDKDFRGINLNYISNKTILGAFVDATVGYKNMLYLNVQGRNDWASTHEKDYRSLFYPGASISFIPTTAFPGMKSAILDFLKLRVGYGTTANFATPYRTRPYLTLNSNASVDGNGNVITLALPALLANKNLKPELLNEIEFGIEANTYNKRFGVDLSFYKRTAKDQIIQRSLDPSTGFDETFINAGTLSNKGIELGLNIVPVKFRDFEWTLRANFTKNISLVESLPEGSKEILISGFSDLGNFAVEGQPFNVIKTYYTKKNDKGQLLVTENGGWDFSNEIAIVGDPNPDFLLTGITDIKFKGVSLGVHLDYVQGGDVYSYTAGGLIGRGVAKELTDFNPSLPVIIPGFKADGTPNDIPTPASGLFFSNNIIGSSTATDRGIYDGTRLRLREVSLNIDIPSKWLSKSFISGGTIAIIGNNMWFRAFNTPKSSKVDIDRTPFGTENGAGFDFLGGPSAKRYGATIRLTF
jgi:TonB-linked SusC/RagA family outer membrane protein